MTNQSAMCTADAAMLYVRLSVTLIRPAVSVCLSLSCGLTFAIKAPPLMPAAGQLQWRRIAAKLSEIRLPINILVLDNGCVAILNRHLIIPCHVLVPPLSYLRARGIHRGVQRGSCPTSHYNLSQISFRGKFSSKMQNDALKITHLGRNVVSKFWAPIFPLSEIRSNLLTHDDTPYLVLESLNYYLAT